MRNRILVYIIRKLYSTTLLELKLQIFHSMCNASVKHSFSKIKVIQISQKFGLTNMRL